MKDEEERGKTEKKRGDLAKKFMLKWVEKKNNGSEGRTKFDIPKVNFNFLKVFFIFLEIDFTAVKILTS